MKKNYYRRSKERIIQQVKYTQNQDIQKKIKYNIVFKHKVVY